MWGELVFPLNILLPHLEKRSSRLQALRELVGFFGESSLLDDPFRVFPESPYQQEGGEV